MQLKFKKFGLLSTIFVYCASFLLQSNLGLFQAWARETNVPRVNIVAILVDNKIYDGIADGLKWYASDYVQQQLSDTKALVIPIDLEKINAYDIYRMMENIYFDGLKDVNSSLIGLIMFGDIPLPVVNQDGYIFPTVYPYVDFEDQKYIWDPSSKYFVPNGNLGGQAEIWHGLINYGTDIDAYYDFFDKIGTYIESPDDFIGDSLWYEDLISQKKGFLDENFPYYRNRIMFGEDLGYQRYSPLMKQMFRGEGNNNASDIISELQDAAGLQFDGWDTLDQLATEGNDSLHTTKMVEQEIKTSFISDYNDLFSKINLSTMRENVFAGGRWIKEYEDSDGKKSLIVDSDSSAAKIQLKDDMYLGNDDLQGLIENLNSLMEEMIDRKVEAKHYSMDIVIPLNYQETTGKRVKHRCFSFVDKYDNYYFGDNAFFIDSAENLSIYRGTYRNLLDLSGVTYDSLAEGKNPSKSEYDDTELRLKSIGGSYDIFSSQAEGNRGFTMVKVEDDLDIYDDKKVADEERSYHQLIPLVYRMKWLEFCEDDINDGDCETIPDFVNRWWGGASSINLDGYQGTSKYYLKDYKATDSWRPIFAVDGSQTLTPGDDEGPDGKGWVDGRGVGPQWAATSYKAFEKYSSPTLKETWDYGFRFIFIPVYLVYSQHVPDVHINFSDLNYRNLPVGVVRGWNSKVESNNIFHLWKRNSGRILSCGKAWDLGYKVLSSIVKHKSTTDEQINGIDRDRYGENGTLIKYYKDVKSSYDDLQFDMDDIISSFSGLMEDIEEANRYMKSKLDELQGKLDDLERINGDLDTYNSELSGMQAELVEAEQRPGQIQGDIDELTAKLAGYNRDLEAKNEDLEGYESSIDALSEEIAGLNEDLDALMEDPDANADAISDLESQIRSKQDDLDAEIGDYEALQRDVTNLNTAIQNINNRLQQLSEDLSDANAVDLDAMRADIDGKQGQIDEKLAEKAAVQADIETILKEIAEIIKKENKKLEDVYKIIMGLFAQSITNVLDFIIYIEGGNPDDYHPELGGTGGPVKILFTQEWIDNIKDVDQDIRDKTNVVKRDYTYVYDLIVDQQGLWNELAEKLKEENEEYVEEIDEISGEMDAIFDIFKDGCDDEVNSDDDFGGFIPKHPGGDDDGDCESVKLTRNTAEKGMKLFKDDLDIVDGVFDMAVALDTVGPRVVEAAKGDSDFIRWMFKHSINFREFSDADWINQYAQWASGPGYDSEGSRINHNLLKGLSEHLSGMNILTPDRPIDSPRYISMQSVAGNEIKLIYPDLFKVEVFNDEGGGVHSLLHSDDIKARLIKYLNTKVDEYNTILSAECDNALPIDIYYARLQRVGFPLATPDTSLHSCGDFFSYDDFLDAIGGEEMLDVIADILYYQSLTNKDKKSAESVEKDIKYVKKSFNINDKREYVLEDYLVEGMEKIKHPLFVIPTYEKLGYEVAYVNSDGKDYIFYADEDDEELYNLAKDFELKNLSKSNDTANLNRDQPTQQEKDIDDECNIPPSGVLPLFKLDGGSVSSPWLVGFKCWWKKTLEEPIKINLSFDSSLGDVVVSSGFNEFIESLGKSLISETEEELTSWGDAMSQYADSWDSLVKPKEEKDSDKRITQMQVEAEKHNREVTGGEGTSYALYNFYRNIKVENSNDILSDSNPLSELKIESISDVGNVNVEFIGVGEGCLNVDGNVLCDGGSFTKTFNPKLNPFTGLVYSADHIAGKMGLDIKISFAGGYIEKVIKYTISPSFLDRFEISIEDNKTIAGMISPVIVTGYDKYDNVVSRGLEKYEFTVSQGKFLKDGVYQDSFETNDFRDLKFYYQAPLDAPDGSVAIIQIAKAENSTVDNRQYMGTYQQPIVQANPIVALNGNLVLSGRYHFENDVEYRLTPDEGIYDGGKLDVSKLQRLDIEMRDANGRVVDVDSQILVTSQNGLVVVGQVQQKDGDEIFFETSKNYMSEGRATVYYYMTTVAGNDVIKINIPGLDTRFINLSIKPAPLDNVQVTLEKDVLNLGETMDVELFLSDVWGNLVDQSYTVNIKYDDDRIDFLDFPGAGGSIDVPVDDGYRKLKIIGFDAGLAYISSEDSFQLLNVDKHIMPTSGLNIMYLNYFGDDWGNQWGYFSDNKQYIEGLMKDSNKIITTTTQLVSENKIKKIEWKMSPGFKIWNPGKINTVMNMVDGDLYMIIGGATDMRVQSPSFTWMQVTTDTMNTLLSNDASASRNYVFFVPSDPKYSVDRDGILYNSGVGIASIMDGKINLKLSDSRLDNGDNVWEVVDRGTNYGSLIVHYPDFEPNVNDFAIPGERYLIDYVFTEGSTHDLSSVGVFDGLSQFELDTSYKSIQNSDEVLEQIGFLGDFKNITLFAEGEIVGEATKTYGSEFVINIGDPVLSRKGYNENVYGTDYDGGIGREVYADSENNMFGTYQIDFNNDGLKDLLAVYLDGSVKISKNYGGTPDLKNMQDLMRIAVPVNEIFIGDADGNGYEDILVLTKNNQLRAYLNRGGIFDVDGSVACLNQNVFEGEISSTPSNLEDLHQIFVEDMDLDGFTDIITYDEKGYIKVFYGGSTNGGPNYLSTKNYACDTGWYDREKGNVTIVAALGVQVTDEDIYDNSMLRWVGLDRPPIEIGEDDLEDFGINFDPNDLEGKTKARERRSPGSLNDALVEMMDKDKFDVEEMSESFIEGSAKYVDETLYENTLVGGGNLKNYVFSPSSYLDPGNPDDIGSVRKNYYVKSGGAVLMEGDIVTVRVTVKASDRKSFVGSYGDIIQGPWNVYYDDYGILEGIRFLKNKRNAVVKSRDGSFSYIIDNITLSPGETMVFEYDLEYTQIPLRDISVTYVTFWSDDDYPDIKMQSVDGCVKDFDVYVNSGESRVFNYDFIPLQDMIDEIYEDEDEMTEDYAEDIMSIGGDANQLPGVVGDSISRIKLLEGGSSSRDTIREGIMGGFDELGVSLSMDLSVFDEQLSEIENVVDDITKGMCNGFSFGGSSNCKGLPVPFNQAFLAPGKYHLFGCWDLPMGPLEGGLPIFFFPGTLHAGPYEIPFPWGFKLEDVDGFIWPDTGIYPSFVRIYAAPTLTAQLGIAICLGTYMDENIFPSPLADVAGNCIVFAVKPQCKSGDDDGDSEPSENPNQSYEPIIEDVRDSGICLQSQKGPMVTQAGMRSSPFNLYSYRSQVRQTDGSRSNFDWVDGIRNNITWNNMDVNGGSNNHVEYSTSFYGIIELETNATYGLDENFSDNTRNSITIGDVEILGGEFDVNKIRGGIRQGVRKILIDKWLDPQIRYIVNQLTKMHVNIKFPNLSNLIDNEVGVINNVSENIGSIFSVDLSDLSNDFGRESGSVSKWSSINYDNLRNFNNAISNPFESLASLMSESNIINISTEPIMIKIPMIFKEDVDAYSFYLRQWLDENEEILNEWRNLLEPLVTSCGNEPSESERVECYNRARENLESFIEFEQSDWPRLQNQIYANLMVLQEYRNFPFELYEWIHVIDRYMSEIASLINNTIGYLAYWTSTNSERFVGYVDAIVLVLNIIKTYQILINFSVEWSQNCGNCARDTYDQYSCKLSMLCDMIELPIIQIPNFKLPNITIDLTNIDLGLDIILPEFNFQPIRIDLPDLPNLPEPPSIGANIKLLDLPNIPLLPEPPELPELPSFIPEVELELPILPPAPELPRIPNEIEVIIKVAKLIGKIYCIVKGSFGLVGESSVKAKIEQLTQRTYEVEWIDRIMDFTNLSAGPIRNYGVDYEISSYVDLQFNFSDFYDYLDMLANGINNLTTSSVNWVNQQANDLYYDLTSPVTDGINKIDGLNFDIDATLLDLDSSDGNDGLISKSDYSSFNVDLDGLTSDEVEYVDYNEAKDRLKEVLTYFKYESADTTLKDTVSSSIDKIENQIDKPNVIKSNVEGLEKVQNQVLAYLDKEKTQYDSLSELINNDYDGFLAMVESQYGDENVKSNSDKEKVLAFNVQLFDVDSSTKDTINSIKGTNPYETLLSNKKTIIDGYWNAVQSNSATDLGLSPAQYLVLRNNIGEMKNQVSTLYSITRPASSTNLIAKNGSTKSNKTLLAGGERLGSNMDVASEIDPSAFSDGIYEVMTEGEDAGKFTKVVYADSFASKIGSRYYHTSHSAGHNIVLWDENSIYWKCAGQVCSTDGGVYGGYYHSDVVDEIPYEETWLVFDRDTKLKIADVKEEVKDWKAGKQTYSVLSFSWTLGNADGYLIKFVERVDNSYEKVDYTSVATPVHYVLALPDRTNIEELYENSVGIELLNKIDSIEDLEGNDISEIVYYDEHKKNVNVTIANVDRKWYYSRIAALDLVGDNYYINSPRSNQVVAGKQIVGDDQAPVGDPVLHRPSIDEIVSEGDDLEGYVGTEYKLEVKWKDNVALSYINLSKDGEILDEKYTMEAEDSVSVDIDLHTKSEKEEYMTVGIDQFGNKLEKKISVAYYIPDIMITDISKNSDGGSVSVVAELSQDIDQGNVSFQRRRGSVWKTMREDIPIGVGIYRVVGGPYSIGTDIAMYDKNGNVMATMSPNSAEVKLQTGYEVKVVVGDGSVLQVQDKETEKVIFSITVPAEECVKLEADDYTVTDLPKDGKMGMYNGGRVVYKDGNNVLFISSKCSLFSELGLEGTYEYDRELEAVKFTLYQLSDLAKKYPIKLWFKAKPFFQN